MTESAVALTNQQMRMTPPVFTEKVDTGGMFKGQVAVYFDPTPGLAKPYLAVCTDSFGGGKQGRRTTRDEAVTAAWTFHEEDARMTELTNPCGEIVFDRPLSEYDLLELISWSYAFKGWPLRLERDDLAPSRDVASFRRLALANDGRIRNWWARHAEDGTDLLNAHVEESRRRIEALPHRISAAEPRTEAAD